ncbi:Helix-turn-helix domain-containing protein [Gracilibacillus orientalis]|uniref:Helix-turn-helix domain-containing protein n=1 Tax=Gracilibacillus orientalis TaxID=334253 RepID=A0A1I4PLZ0_9BACI|nr:helix-turn-helix transcriptional regulator [Gracilibacillus orientalis]SFM28644.1 Helix-turn-helix domain-containing protein [Gracilibacillus orientalis]
MKLGELIKRFRDDEGLTQKDFAEEMHVSSSLIALIETNKRAVQEDFAQRTLKQYDDPVYAMEVIREFSDGYTAPRLNGNAVEWHRLALEELAITEVQEAVKILNDVSFVKKPDETELEELDRIENVIAELLDAELAVTNLKAILAKEYHLSLKTISKKRIPYWKSQGWIS